jgi:hypothetical protein
MGWRSTARAIAEVPDNFRDFPDAKQQRCHGKKEEQRKN